jgi:hypothetical protein
METCYYEGMKTASLDILEKTQLPGDQARAILKVMELENTAWAEIFATKGDLKDAFHLLDLKLEAVRAELRGEIEKLRSEMMGMEGKMRGIEGRLTRWVFTCMLGQTAVILGAMYFALNHLRP